MDANEGRACKGHHHRRGCCSRSVLWLGFRRRRSPCFDCAAMKQIARRLALAELRRSLRVFSLSKQRAFRILRFFIRDPVSGPQNFNFQFYGLSVSW